MTQNKKDLTLGASCLILAVLVVGYYLYSHRSQPYFAKPALPETKQNPVDGVIIKKDDYDPLKNSYEYQGKILTEKELPSGSVAVYFSDGKETKTLLTDVIKDVPGATYPTFAKTTDPNLALLQAGTGDAGGYFSEFNIIDLNSLKVLRASYTNGPLVTIIDQNGAKYEIELDIDDPCGHSTDQGNQRKGQAVLKNILVNNIPAYHLNSTILTCVDPGGIGPIYSPDIFTSVVGVSKDLSKVYFNFSGTQYNMQDDKSQLIWNDDYAFVLSTHQIIKENRQNSLFTNNYLAQ